MPDDTEVPNIPRGEQPECVVTQLPDPAALRVMSESAGAIQALKDTMRGLASAGVTFDPLTALKRLQKLRTSTALHRLRSVKIHRPLPTPPTFSDDRPIAPVSSFEVIAPVRLRSISLSRDRVPAAP